MRPVVSEFVYGAKDTDQIDAMLIGSFYKFKKSELLAKCVSTYDNRVDFQTAIIQTKSSKNSTLHCNKKNIPPGCIPRYMKKHKRLIQPWKKSIRNKRKQVYIKIPQREPTNWITEFQVTYFLFIRMLFPEQTHQPTYNSDNLSSTITVERQASFSDVYSSILAQPRASTKAPDHVVVSNNVRYQREVARTPCSQANDSIYCIRGRKINTFYTHPQFTFKLYEIWSLDLDGERLVKARVTVISSTAKVSQTTRTPCSTLLRPTDAAEKLPSRNGDHWKRAISSARDF